MTCFTSWKNVENFGQLLGKDKIDYDSRVENYILKMFPYFFAESGHHYALSFFGRLYEMGYIVDYSEEDAIKWYSLAVEGNLDLVKQKLLCLSSNKSVD